MEFKCVFIVNVIMVLRIAANEKVTSDISTKDNVMEAILDELGNIRGRFIKLEDKLSDQQTINAEQSLTILKLQKAMENYDDRCTTMEPDYHYQDTAFGCFGDLITLSCPNNRTINVTSADYGMYSHACTDCCAPHPTQDCREVVEQNKPSDWLALLYTCTNQTSCAYEYTGANIDQCQPGYLADYMQIYYICRPEVTDEPIGFTAYPSQTRTFNAGAIVLFDAVVSNFGGHYEPTTSTFHCPYNAVYLVNLNLASNHDERMCGQIYRDNEYLGEATAHYTANVKPTASALVITECDAGQVIWIKSDQDNTVMFGFENDIRSLFSVYLLQKLV